MGSIMYTCKSSSIIADVIILRSWLPVIVLLQTSLIRRHRESTLQLGYRLMQLALAVSVLPFHSFILTASPCEAKHLIPNS